MRFDDEVKSDKKSENKPKIDIYHLIDTSSSMGSYYDSYYTNRRIRRECKYSNAIDGFSDEVKKLKEDDSIEYSFSLITFDRPGNGIKWRAKQVKQISDKLIEELKDYRPDDYTALNDAMVEVITKALATAKSTGNKTILTILTDGGENASSRYRAKEEEVKQIVEDAKQFITINFVGVKNDTEKAVNTYGITRSNTMSYDGTAQGMKMSSEARTQATLNYSKRMRSGASGQSLTMDFFSDEQ